MDDEEGAVGYPTVAAPASQQEPLEASFTNMSSSAPSAPSFAPNAYQQQQQQQQKGMPIQNVSLLAENSYFKENVTVIGCTSYHHYNYAIRQLFETYRANHQMSQWQGKYIPLKTQKFDDFEKTTTDNHPCGYWFSFVDLIAFVCVMTFPSIATNYVGCTTSQIYNCSYYYAQDECDWWSNCDFCQDSWPCYDYQSIENNYNSWVTTGRWGFSILFAINFVFFAYYAIFLIIARKNQSMANKVWKFTKKASRFETFQQCLMGIVSKQQFLDIARNNDPRLPNERLLQAQMLDVSGLGDRIQILQYKKLWLKRHIVCPIKVWSFMCLFYFCFLCFNGYILFMYWGYADYLPDNWYNNFITLHL